MWVDRLLPRSRRQQPIHVRCFRTPAAALHAATSVHPCLAFFATFLFMIAGKRIHLSLLANPSHLEAVNTVAMGKVRLD